jgi:hypothetical protein
MENESLNVHHVTIARSAQSGDALDQQPWIMPDKLMLAESPESVLVATEKEPRKTSTGAPMMPSLPGLLSMKVESLDVFEKARRKFFSR